MKSLWWLDAGLCRRAHMGHRADDLVRGGCSRAEAARARGSSSALSRAIGIGANLCSVVSLDSIGSILFHIPVNHLVA